MTLALVWFVGVVGALAAAAREPFHPFLDQYSPRNLYEVPRELGNHDGWRGNENPNFSTKLSLGLFESIRRANDRSSGTPLNDGKFL